MKNSQWYIYDLKCLCLVISCKQMTSGKASGVPNLNHSTNID